MQQCVHRGLSNHTSHLPCISYLYQLTASTGDMQLLRCDGDSARLCRGYVKEREHIETFRLASLAADAAHDTTWSSQSLQAASLKGLPLLGGVRVCMMGSWCREGHGENEKSWWRLECAGCSPGCAYWALFALRNVSRPCVRWTRTWAMPCSTQARAR